MKCAHTCETQRQNNFKLKYSTERMKKAFKSIQGTRNYDRCFHRLSHHRSPKHVMLLVFQNEAERFR